MADRCRTPRALEELPASAQDRNVVLNVAFGEERPWRSDTRIFRLGSRTGLAPGGTPAGGRGASCSSTRPPIPEGRAPLADPARALYVYRAQAACERCAVADCCDYQDKTGAKPSKQPRPAPTARDIVFGPRPTPPVQTGPQGAKRPAPGLLAISGMARRSPRCCALRRGISFPGIRRMTILWVEHRSRIWCCRVPTSAAAASLRKGDPAPRPAQRPTDPLRP